MTFVVGSLLLDETHGTLIWSEVESDRPGGVKSDIEGPV